MRILHVSGAKSWGGNEQQLLLLIKGMEERGFPQFLLCFKDTILEQLATSTTATVYAVEKASNYSFSYMKKFQEIVAANEIDIIHLHTSDALTRFVAADSIRQFKAKTIFSKKGMGSSSSFLSKIKYNYKNIDKILCVSKYVEDNFKEALSKKNYPKLAVVYDGVEGKEEKFTTPFLLKEKYKTGDKLLLGNIANHSKAKDLKTLIKTIHILVNELKMEDIHLIQIGAFSKYTNELQELVKENKLESYVSLTGFIENASAFLDQFDIFVMSSLREGGPSSVLEAFYHKVPVVSTRVGIVDETIKDGTNGFVAEVGNARQLAEKIVVLKNSEELRKQFAERSYSLFMDQFTVDHFVENTLFHYQELMKSL